MPTGCHVTLGLGTCHGKSPAYSYNLTPPISRVLFGHHLIFRSRRHQRAVNRLENVRQLNIRRGKKPGFQLSHRQPPSLHSLVPVGYR